MIFGNSLQESLEQKREPEVGGWLESDAVIQEGGTLSGTVVAETGRINLK